MKNILKKTALLLLSALLFTSTAACGETGKDSSGSSDGGNNDLVIDMPEAQNKGIHEVSVSEGTADFVSGGKIEHCIVIPDGADTTTQTAASELRSFVNDATGETMEIVTDAEVAWGASAKYFVLGAENALMSEAGINVPVEKLGRRGAYVETSGNSVFLAGAASTGTLNAVYEWLHYQLGWEIYGTEEIVQQTGVTDMKLKQMKIIEVPDIEDIASTYGWTDNDPTTANRMRYTGNFWVSVGGNNYHNSFSYLPPDDYKSEKTEWYSDDGTQLCYTAHGDEGLLNEMIQTVTERMKEELIAQPDYENITITQEDTTSWCKCDACTELNVKYGTDAVSAIRFCNEVSRRIHSWFATPDGEPYKRDLKIVFFAYHATENAPVVYDAETDTYSPIDETVVCDDSVGVIYAPITASYQVALNDEYNEKYYENVRGWNAVCKNLYMWTYSTNFHYYLVPTNTYNSMQYNYRFLRDNNTKWLLDQAQYNRIASGFSALKLYLNSKLAWNVDEDMNVLIDAFFENYFGPAAPYMRKYFDELRTHWAYLEGELNYIGTCYLEPLNSAYWPATLLERWIGYIEEAQAELEFLKERDAEKYKMYSENVLLESISPRFLLIDLWPSKFDSKTLYTEKNSFRTDCVALGITNYAEKVDISELWSDWGI